MSEITKEDLHEMKEDIKDTFRRELELRFSALPCHQHDEAIGRIAEKANNAYTSAVLAKQQAESAHALATGRLWDVAKAGAISLCLGAGIKITALWNYLKHSK